MRHLSFLLALSATLLISCVKDRHSASFVVPETDAAVIAAAL